jgi:hypothetical protein
MSNNFQENFTMISDCQGCIEQQSQQGVHPYYAKQNCETAGCSWAEGKEMQKLAAEGAAQNVVGGMYHSCKRHCIPEFMDAHPSASENQAYGACCKRG